MDNTPLSSLEEALLKNTQIGDVLEGTGGARKIRIQFKRRDKSRGRRLIYVDIFEKEHLHFLFTYPKNVHLVLQNADMLGCDIAHFQFAEVRNKFDAMMWSFIA